MQREQCQVNLKVGISLRPFASAAADLMLQPGMKEPLAAASPFCSPSSAVIHASHVQSEGTRGMLSCPFWGGCSLLHSSHMPRRVKTPGATEEGDGGVSSPPWLQIPSFIVLIANASTVVKLLCAEIRPRPSPTQGEEWYWGKPAFYRRDAEGKGMGNIREPDRD